MTTQAERIAAAVKASMLTEGGYTRAKAIEAIKALKIDSGKGNPINATIAYHHICHTKKWAIEYIDTETPRARKAPKTEEEKKVDANYAGYDMYAAA